MWAPPWTASLDRVAMNPGGILAYVIDYASNTVSVILL